MPGASAFRPGAGPGQSCWGQVAGANFIRLSRGYGTRRGRPGRIRPVFQGVSP
jgi:hypothetical protein